MRLVFASLMAVAVDGDTLRCRNVNDANGGVRIARIDMPERCEKDFEEDAKNRNSGGRV